MSVYVIADLHLSISEPEKTMDVFGRRWNGYTEKLKKNWCAVVEPEDTVIVPGDISWALNLEDAVEDFRFIDSLPGRKFLGKGNHDYWWSTMAKAEKLLKDNDFQSISFLYNNAYVIEDYIVTGTRGWFADATYEKIPPETDYEKLVAREAARLRLSLDAGKALKNQYPDKEMLTFLHFPPVWNGDTVLQFTDILSEYGVKRVFFGHIHGNYTVQPSFIRNGITYALISADYLNFLPRPISPSFD